MGFATCFEVDQDLIEQALTPARSLADPAPRDKIFALIERMARIARPRQGAARLLTVFARLAECGWLEGELEILLCDLGEATGIDLMLHDGLSFVRLHAPIRVGVPFNEFTTAYESNPLAVSPLEQAPADLDVLRLRATEATHSRGARNAAEFQIADAAPTTELVSKPTIKLRAVTIPREAYRDGQPPDAERTTSTDKARANADASEQPGKEPITIEMQAVRQKEARDEPPLASETPETKRVVDDIDQGWE